MRISKVFFYIFNKFVYQLPENYIRITSKIKFATFENYSEISWKYSEIDF